MDYKDAIIRVINHQDKIRLPHWKGYLFMNDSRKLQHKEGKISILVEDYLRLDWEIVEKSKKAKCIMCDKCLREDKAGIDAEWEQFNNNRWLCRECARIIAMRVAEEY